MKRRDILTGSVFGAVALAGYPMRSLATAKPDARLQLAALEREHGGRLGVAILDVNRNRCIAHRGNERFLSCSTFKLLLVAAVLARVDRGADDLARRIVFHKDALLDWAPVTGLNVGAPGMTLQALCEAAIIMSDNTAANLLLDALQGPAAVTAYARTLGDTVTRLDHREPLSGRQQGEEDSTTPLSMLADMRKILLGTALSAASRNRLIRWLVLNQTGAQSLRAGLPSNWRIGDRTGAATHANNDVAVLWPRRDEPWLVTAYYMTRKADTAQRKAVLARVGSIVASLSA